MNAAALRALTNSDGVLACSPVVLRLDDGREYEVVSRDVDQRTKPDPKDEAGRRLVADGAPTLFLNIRPTVRFVEPTAAVLAEREEARRKSAARAAGTAPSTPLGSAK
jgi:hypothetical protein